MKVRNICVTLFAAVSFLMCNSASAQSTGNSTTTIETPKFQPTGNYTPWPRISMTDITTRRRVWEDIDLTDKKNNLFGPHNTGIALENALITGADNAKIITYSPVDDRFTTPLKPAEFSAISEQIKSGNTHITKFMIKEDSLFLNTGAITVRILGIAPVAIITAPDGTTKEQPLFWIFYPDCREYLSRSSAAGSYTWNDVLERRDFSGKVTKVIDHPISNSVNVKK